MTPCLLHDLSPNQLRHVCNVLVDGGGRLQMAYAWHAPAGVEVRYLVSTGARKPFELWRCQPASDLTLPSLAQEAPLLSWYEREMADLHGLVFRDHPEPHALVLHEGARAATPPLDPAYPSDQPLTWVDAPAELPHIKNHDVQLLPFGPVRADVLESAQFLFFYVGESILHYHPRLFFKHRGMEKRFEGKDTSQGIILAERVSGVGSVAHSLAYCQAVEAAASCVVPPRAAWLRVLLAELERLYNHLHYLGHLCHTTTLKVGEAQGKLLEEKAKQLNGLATGSRFLRGLLVPGGLAREPALHSLSDSLEALRQEFASYRRLLERTDSHRDRLLTTGHLSKALAFDQGATGPVERASGLDRDLRRDHPYAAYADLPLAVAGAAEGDAHARASVRMDEIEASLALLQRVLLMLPEGPLRAPCAPTPGSEGLGWAESPRGSLFYAVHMGQDGRLARVKVKSPSFSNWRVFPYTVHDSNMMDYAINEASFGLTVAGCDR